MHDVEDPGYDDFELWSPSEERAERCLFGRRVCFLRVQYLRLRLSSGKLCNVDECMAGTKPKAVDNIKNCPCTKVSFEW